MIVVCAWCGLMFAEPTGPGPISHGICEECAEQFMQQADDLETEKRSMQKIISLFQRNYDGNRLVRDEVTPGAEWVVAGEGVATRKWDGTCCMIRGAQLFKRY